MVAFVVVGRHTCTERERYTHARTHAERETHARTHAHMHTHTHTQMILFGRIFRVLGDGRWFCGGWDLGSWLGVVGGWPSICKWGAACKCLDVQFKRGEFALGNVWVNSSQQKSEYLEKSFSKGSCCYRAWFSSSPFGKPSSFFLCVSLSVLFFSCGFISLK